MRSLRKKTSRKFDVQSEGSSTCNQRAEDEQNVLGKGWRQRHQEVSRTFTFKSRADAGAKRIYIDMLKLRTKCARCGQVRHWGQRMSRAARCVC